MTTIPQYTFDELLQHAAENKWCVQTFCTTCGSTDFRKALESSISENEEAFVQSTCEFQFDRISSYHEFTAAVYHVFNQLRSSDGHFKILDYWIERPDLPVRVADYLFFYIVRSYSRSETGKRWLSKCIELAEKEKDISLTETLILSLRSRAQNHESLILLATELSTQSKKISNLIVKFSLMK